MLPGLTKVTAGSESPGSFFLARAPRGRDAFCERRRRFRPDAFHVGVAREYE